MSVKKIKVTRYDCQCDKCNRTWESRTDQLPNICPFCKTPNWNKRKGEKKGRKEMIPKVVWTYQECYQCDGFGMEYCLTCEGRCDHDQLCRKCKGNGEIPEKIVPIVMFGVWLNRPTMRGNIATADKQTWLTRREVQLELDTFDMHGQLR